MHVVMLQPEQAEEGPDEISPIQFSLCSGVLPADCIPQRTLEDTLNGHNYCSDTGKGGLSWIISL